MGWLPDGRCARLATAAPTICLIPFYAYDFPSPSVSARWHGTCRVPRKLRALWSRATRIQVFSLHKITHLAHSINGQLSNAGCASKDHDHILFLDPYVTEPSNTSSHHPNRFTRRTTQTYQIEMAKSFQTRLGAEPSLSILLVSNEITAWISHRSCYFS